MKLLRTFRDTTVIGDEAGFFSEGGYWCMVVGYKLGRYGRFEHFIKGCLYTYNDTDTTLVLEDHKDD